MYLPSLDKCIFLGPEFSHYVTKGTSKLCHTEWHKLTITMGAWMAALPSFCLLYTSQYNQNPDSDSEQEASQFSSSAFFSSGPSFTCLSPYALQMEARELRVVTQLSEQATGTWHNLNPTHPQPLHFLPTPCQHNIFMDSLGISQHTFQSHSLSSPPRSTTPPLRLPSQEEEEKEGGGEREGEEEGEEEEEGEGEGESNLYCPYAQWSMV